MTHRDASYYMTTQEGDAPQVGYFVQRRAPTSSTWNNMGLTWPTREEAEKHASSIMEDIGWVVRICKCEHTPQP